jgi:carboxyl-terminal processing protease
MPKSRSRLLLVGVVLAGIGVLPLAGLVAAPRNSQPTKLSTSDLALIGGVIQLVQHDYVHPVDSATLTDDALKGLLNRLDPHSDYMNEQEFHETQADISGKFGGLGIQISSQNGVPKVIAPIDGTPADKAGMQPGDLIVTIDGQSTQGMGLTKIVRLLRGDPGTKVTIAVLRGNKKPFDVTITRSIIQVASVKSKMLANNVGYVRVTEFGEDTASDFKKAVEKLKQESGGLKGFVLDLRNDPGGLLSAAVSIGGDFLGAGTVVSIHGRNPNDDHVYKSSGGELLTNVPVVTLINGASASASEIVAGALQDRKRATIMGTQSFGKGSVQTVIPLNGHGALRLTTALYYTPSGRSIQGQGIAPNVVVEAPKDQQVEGGLVLRESQLQGAFTNPGPLNGKPDATPAKPAVKTPAAPDGQTQQSGSGDDGKKFAEEGRDSYSPPIKNELIGTDKDAQLQAALDYLRKNPGITTGQAAQ